MMKNAARKSLVSLLALAAVTACTESTGTDGSSSTSGAQNKPVLMGSFAINTGTVTTNQDGTSKNVIDDYVLPSQLPNVNFEVFTIHLLAPAASDVSTSVSSVRAYVKRTDGSRTGDIFQEGHFVQRITYNGQEYSVYQLNAFYAAPPTLTKANFANVSFEMSLKYSDTNGATLAERAVTLGVYQRQ
jgi:hypothetical protein